MPVTMNDRPRRRWRGRMAIGLAICGAVGLAGALVITRFGESESSDTPRESHFVLDITGDAEAVFSVECHLQRPEGDQVIMLEGPAPLRRELSGSRLSCTITQHSDQGMLRVVLAREPGSYSWGESRGRGVSQMTVE